MVNFASLLTSEQVERTHQAALEILEQVGVLVHNPKARQIFSKHGCQLNAETNIVKFPPSVVEEYRKLAPPKFTFYGREERLRPHHPGRPADCRYGQLSSEYHRSGDWA